MLALKNKYVIFISYQANKLNTSLNKERVNNMNTLTNVSLKATEVIDTRDIVELIAEVENKITELESEIDDLNEDSEDFETNEDTLKNELAEIQAELESYQVDLEMLENIKDEVGSEFEYGEQLIRDDYFTEYQKEMLIDCGTLPNDLPWFIENNIDWDAVAEDLKVDYSEIEIEGETYHFRNC